MKLSKNLSIYHWVHIKNYSSPWFISIIFFFETAKKKITCFNDFIRCFYMIVTFTIFFFCLNFLESSVIFSLSLLQKQEIIVTFHSPACIVLSDCPTSGVLAQKCFRAAASRVISKQTFVPPYSQNYTLRKILSPTKDVINNGTFSSPWKVSLFSTVWDDIFAILLNDFVYPA